MPIYRLSELLPFLQQLGIYPKKGLSQNFLVDGNILRKVVELADVQAGELILEVGSGPGALTEMLLDRHANVIAIEKDAVLASALSRLGPNLKIYNEDILKFPFQACLQERLLENQKAKLVANLPYHLTSPIPTRFVTQFSLFSHLVVMVQSEVADRMVAKPNESDYSSLTVFLHYYAEVSYGFKVSKNCFYPPPDVDSAVVSLKLKPGILSSENEVQFLNMMRTAFQQRRKMLRSSLSSRYQSALVETALRSLNLSPMARPQELSLDNFMRFFLFLEKEKGG